MKIEHNGTVYKADDKKDMMRVLRQARLTYSKIGGLIGCSRAYVGHVLNRDFNIYGNLDFPELGNPSTFESKTDEQIARNFNIPVYRVSHARKRLNLKMNNIIKLHRRRRDLVKFLFGMQYNPGQNFDGWLERIIQPFNRRQIEIMVEFYIEGATESTHENINSDTARVYRSVTRKRLKEEVSQLDRDNLVKVGVLKNGRNSKSN